LPQIPQLVDQQGGRRLATRQRPRHLTMRQAEFRRGNREARVAKVPIPAVATDVGWQLAVVTRTDKDGAAIGFKGGAIGRIPFSEMRWARLPHDNGKLGPYPRTVSDVIKPGDVVMVEPTIAVSKGEPLNAKTPAPYTLCQVPEISGALVAMDPHTGRVLAISGGSVSRSASSTVRPKPNGNPDRRSNPLSI